MKKQGKLLKIFKNVIKIFEVSGINIDAKELPDDAFKSSYYESNDLESSLTTAIENLQRAGLKVFTSNEGDFFTIKVLSVCNSSSGQYKIYYIFAFEYGQRTRGLENDPVVVISMKIKKD